MCEATPPLRHTSSWRTGHLYVTPQFKCYACSDHESCDRLPLDSLYGQPTFVIEVLHGQVVFVDDSGSRLPKITGTAPPKSATQASCIHERCRRQAPKNYWHCSTQKCYTGKLYSRGDPDSRLPKITGTAPPRSATAGKLYSWPMQAAGSPKLLAPFHPEVLALAVCHVLRMGICVR
jgi:hypothetical protein